MNKVRPTPKTYRSALRGAQAEMTRQRIREAAAELLDGGGEAGAITFKAVAERAEVTEMTVYRHFPNRDALLKGVWQHLNARMGPEIGMPASEDELRRQHRALLAGFDDIAPQIVAAIGTPQGREMRASLNEEREAAFLAIADEVAPHLDPHRKRQAAALLQLLHSAYAWASLREQWNFTGDESAEATQWLIDLILNDIREPRP